MSLYLVHLVRLTAFKETTMFNAQVFGPGLVALSIFIILLLVCREVICWYLKVNKTIVLLEKIEEKIRQENGGIVKPLEKTEDKTIDKALYDTMRSINEKFKI